MTCSWTSHVNGRKTMKDEILAALSQLEVQHGCRFLFAAESGSRAWGFASSDSDYDVRVTL